MLHPHEWGIKNVLGELSNSQQLWESDSAYHLIDNILKEDVPAMLISINLTNPALEENRCFFHKATELNLPI